MNQGAAYRALIGVVAVFMLLLAWGCGSSDDSMTKADFVKAANKICIEQEEARVKGLMETSRKLGVANGELPDRKTQEKITLGAVPAVAEEARRIEELDPPEGEEEEVEAVVDAIDNLAKGIEKSPGTALASGTLFRKLNKVARAYGLDKCDF